MAEQTEDLLEEQRENWGTRAGFVLAAVGSAVGLGNLWGFPYKLYSYGGGAFLIPYVLAMVLIGIPLLIGEFSLGHITQRATPDAFGRVNRKFAFVGWWQIILSFIIVTYYAVILAWCLSFLAASVAGIFTDSLPWAAKGAEGVARAKEFFNVEYLNKHDAFRLGGVQWHIVAALVITWLAMYLCIFRGVRLVSKVVLWTVPLPWLMLLILAVRGLTLPGATQGLEYYLEPDWSRLANPETWRWGFGQMFFSMSLAFGIMITYSSFLHRKSDLNNNAAIIGLADIATSFVAGLAVFATLGGMAYAGAQAGNPIAVQDVADKGPGLAFVAFPYALAQLPHAAWFSAVFFSSLLLLGLDSAFSITESVLASVVDKTGWKRLWVLIAITLIGLAAGLAFCTQGGINWVGTFDSFINGTWGITLTALLECVVLGWLFRLRRLRDHANERSDWKLGLWWHVAIRGVIPVVLAGLFAWSLFDGLNSPRGYIFDYESDAETITIPAPRGDELPADAKCRLRFVADFNGAVEKQAELDADKIRDGRLSYTAEGLPPATAMTAEYQWAGGQNSNNDWLTAGKFTTTSRKTGLNLGNAVGMGAMGLAPVLAVVITSLRFRKRLPQKINVLYESTHPHGRAVGAMLLIVVLGGAAVLVCGAGELLHAGGSLRYYGRMDEVASSMNSARLSLMLGAAGGLVAFVIGGLLVRKYESVLALASMLLRMAAGGGMVVVGLAVGLALAAWTLTSKFAAAGIEYDNELSGESYLILAAMLTLVVGGLAWCFYRAIKAAGGAPEEPQEEESTD